MINAILLLHVTLTTAQVPGTMDSSFAVNGISLLQPSSGFDNAYSVVMLDDGKMLIGGGSQISGSSNWDVVVYRLNPDGSVDETFGNNGFAFHDYLGYSEYVRSMIRLSNGKLLFVGGAEINFQVDFFATLLNEDGTIDDEFGDNGTVLLSIGSGEDIGIAAVEQADGKLLIVGNSDVPGFTYKNSIAVRLNPDGTPDEEFGTDGIAHIDAGYDYESAEDVWLMDDGSLLAVGYVGNQHYDLLTFRLDDSGMLHPDYGTGGIAVYNLNNGDDMAYAITRSPVDGRILIGGRIGDGSSKTNMLVLSVTETGLIDSTFGTNGKATLHVKTNDAGLDLEVQNNGRLVLGGTAGNGFAANDFVVCRFNQDGTIDSTFGTNGYTLSEISSFFSGIEGIALQDDGKIVAVGIAASANNDMGIVRYQGDDVATGIISTSNAATDVWSHVYPNPSTGGFFLNIQDKTNYSGNAFLTITHLLGQPVFSLSTRMHDGNLTEYINASQVVEKGTYLITVSYESTTIRKPLLLVK